MSARRLADAAAALALASAAALAAGVLWALAPAASTGPEIVFAVERGSSLVRVARDLEAAGLVRSASALEWYARLRGLADRLKAGDYGLTAAMSPAEILALIESGRVKTYQVAIPEGFTAAEIASLLERKGLVDAEAFLELVRDPASPRAFGVEGPTLEGYLFPETYQLPRGLSAEEIAKLLVDQFQSVWVEIGAQARARGLSMREVVTLASIVEKETGAPEERPLIASVFHNRLQRRMRLESDPTVIYGIPDFDGNLRRRDLENGANPYNTYRIAGLPPGAIASPGADALRAALSPADSDYLYFVSRNDGTHRFSVTYREHVNAVNRFQKRRK